MFEPRPSSGSGADTIAACRTKAPFPVAFIEKLAFGAAVIALYIAHRIQVPILIFGLIDLVLGGLFLAAFVVLPNRRNAVKFSRSSHGRSEGRANPTPPGHRAGTGGFRLAL